MEHTTKPRPDQSEIPQHFVFLSCSASKMLSIIPMALLIYVVAQYAVDVPFLDQWELVPLLDKMYHGELTFHDLWAQQNEHRIFFPRIIMLVLARLTHWNINYELALNIIFALGIFAIFVYQIKITGRKLAVACLPWAIPAVSLVVFSVSQYQNWLWGWQLLMFLNVLAVVGGIVLLANEPFRWWKFAAATLLGVVATYSFANGALFWPIGLMILFLLKTGARQKGRAAAIWILIGTLTLGGFFYQYQEPDKHSLLGLFLGMPVEYAAYVFKYIGGICAPHVGGDISLKGTFAFVFGLAATITGSWVAWALCRRKIADPGTLLPYFSLCLYSVGSALVTGIGRLDLGSNQALASRYCTMTTPLWVSLIVFLILLMNNGKIAAGANAAERKPGSGTHTGGCQIVAGLSLLTAIVLLVLGSVYAITDAKDLSQRQADGRKCLLKLAANPQAGIDYRGLSEIYPWPQVIVARYPVLYQHRLSLFRHQEITLDAQ